MDDEIKTLREWQKRVGPQHWIAGQLEMAQATLNGYIQAGMVPARRAPQFHLLSEKVGVIWRKEWEDVEPIPATLQKLKPKKREAEAEGRPAA